jgi:L-threonylcarbamoyladenylate synthase
VSGAAAPSSFKEINEAIVASVNYVVKYRQNEVSDTTPSSIIKWENGRIIVVRE